MDMEKNDTQYWMAMLEVSECCQIGFHLLVYVAVAGKCFAAFGMPRQRSHKVRVFDLLIQIPDKSTARHMG